MPSSSSGVTGPRERYEMRHPLASGGMATVYLGRMSTHAGLSRTIAIKRLHPHVASDPAFVAMFFDEARLAMRIQHPNVVGTFDVAQVDGEQLLVMDYIHGESLVTLMHGARARTEPIPPAVFCSIMGGVLAGLHAAHEARSESGEPLGIVHRDVSPQNVLVGVDGVARVLDFGVAKAVGRMQTTETGQVKGKLAYMAPEQMTARDVDRRADLFAAGTLLWEGLANRRLFDGDGPAQIVSNVLSLTIPPPRGLGDALDHVALRALERHPDQRFATARDMAIALEQAFPSATPHEVESWLRSVASTSLAARSALVVEMESGISRKAATDGARGAGDASANVAALAARSGPEDDTMSATGHSLVTTPRRRRGGRGLLTVVALLLLAAPVVVFGFMRRTAHVQPVELALAAPPDPPPAPVSAPSPEPSASVADESPSPDAAALPAVALGRPAPAVAPRAIMRPRTSTTGASKKPNCTSPFTVTADGIRVPRPECF